jgi:hypothetical protein
VAAGRQRPDCRIGTIAAVAWAGVILGVVVCGGYVLWQISYARQLWRWMRWHESAQRCWRGQCPGCGYDLTGNVSGVCPECGRDYR